ncbi:hypothetical protein [Noviherbaspirillum sp.]|uniref:hypothetical protein n=1 Tax=Noviherbaspirillum sp. TaxID=1926288 RepID=UPI0025CE8A41|nr:hypothetical protein [Noviherbaspirillum sp.]
MIWKGSILAYRPAEPLIVPAFASELIEVHRGTEKESVRENQSPDIARRNIKNTTRMCIAAARKARITNHRWQLHKQKIWCNIRKTIKEQDGDLASTNV